MLARPRPHLVSLFFFFAAVPAASGQDDSPKKLFELRIPTKTALAAAFSPDGKALITTTRDRDYSIPAKRGAEWSLRRYDAATGRELAVWKKQPETEVRYAVFSPDGRVLARVENSGRLTLIDTATGAELRSWSMPLGESIERTGDSEQRHKVLDISSLFFSLEGAKLGALRGKSLFVWDCATGEKTREVALHDGTKAARAGFMPDGRTLLTAFQLLGSPARTIVRDFDLQTRQAGREFSWPAGGMPTEFLASPDGHSVVIHAGSTVYIYEALAGVPRASEAFPRTMQAVALSSDGRWIAVGGPDGVVRLRRGLSADPAGEWEAGPESITGLAISPDGSRLVSISANSAAVWELDKFVRLKVRPAVRLSDDHRQALWRALGRDSGRESSQALIAFVDDGVASTPFLVQQIKVPPGSDAAKIDRWVAELGSERFAEREKATRSLEGAGDLARPALRKVIDETNSAEMRRRAEQILGRLKGQPIRALQIRRGLEALELLGAVDELRALSTELTDTAHRDMAKAAVTRLKTRQAR